MQTATRKAAIRPCGIRRLGPYPATVKMPFTSVTIDPDTQTGVFRDGEGLTKLDSRNDQGSDQDSQPTPERPDKIPPVLLDEWMPAFLAQLTAPGAQFVRATAGDGTRHLYLFDPERESFAAFTEDTAGWAVRQGGPLALWDAVEETLTAWQDAGSPDIANVRLHITKEAHTYRIGDRQALRWGHRLA